MKYLDLQDLVVRQRKNKLYEYIFLFIMIDYNRESQSFLMHFPGLTFFFNQIGPQVEVIHYSHVFLLNYINLIQ